MPIIPPKPLAEVALGVRGLAEQDRALLVAGGGSGAGSRATGLLAQAWSPAVDVTPPGRSLVLEAQELMPPDKIP